MGPPKVVLILVRAGKFFWYFLFLFLTLLYYSFYGILTVVISPSVQACSLTVCCRPRLRRQGHVSGQGHP